MAGLAGCSFDSAGLGPTGEGGQAGTEAASSGAASTGGPDTTTAPTTAPTTGATTQASGTGESGGPGSESGDASSGAVDPGTGTSTTDATTTGPATTTGMDTTTAGESSSGGCDLAFYADTDKDGFGDPEKVMMACMPPEGHVANADDCDDGNIEIKPGADEVCDQKDNDCDELVDEWNPPMNIECDGCKMALYDNKVYHFCTTPERWVDAMEGCKDRGVALAEDTDTAEHTWLVNQLPPNSGPWYIGANAPGEDDNFVWLGGSAVPDPDDRWGAGRPAGSGSTHYLSLLSDGNLLPWLTYNGKWFDRAENDKEPYVCEGPVPP